MRDAGAIVTQHLLDCLAAVPPLRRRAADAARRRILDVGSGAGLPGLVIGIAEPGTEVVCVDSVGKKAAFVAQAAGAPGLDNVEALHARVEAIRRAAVRRDHQSRVFASLSALSSATSQHLADAGVWMAMKGKQPDDEIDELDKSIAVFQRGATRVPQPGRRSLPGLDAPRISEM